MSNDLGYPDIGLTSLKDVSNRSKQIARVTSLPTIVDIDTAIAGSTDANKIKVLELKKEQLLDQASKSGASEVTQNPAESWFKTRQKQRQIFSHFISQ